MKVLFNVYPVAFDCPGGGEIQLLKTKEALDKVGTQALLYDLWKPQLKEVDIVHYFSVQGGSYNFCNYVKSKGLPLVISPILWPKGDTSHYPMDEIRHLLNIADLIFPNSQMEAELLSQVFQVPLEKFYVTYNGIDDIFLQEVPADLFLKEFSLTRPFLLNVANIEERKNQLSLARALKNTDYHLILMGNIRDQNYYQQCLAEGNGRIRYLGHLPHHSPLLRSAYQAASLFVLPSFCETPGLAALEAAAQGAKLVITEEGSTREYFQDWATYINPYSLESILSGVHSAFSSTLQQRERSSELKQHIQKYFTWEQTAIQAQKGYQMAKERFRSC